MIWTSNRGESFRLCKVQSSRKLGKRKKLWEVSRVEGLHYFQYPLKNSSKEWNSFNFLLAEIMLLWMWHPSGVEPQGVPTSIELHTFLPLVQPCMFICYLDKLRKQRNKWYHQNFIPKPCPLFKLTEEMFTSILIIKTRTKMC